MLSQDHLILVFKFPEYYDEYTMAYSKDEREVVEQDARNFSEMYPQVLYVQVFFVSQHGFEEKLYEWNNPQASQLIRKFTQAGISAGAAMSGFPITSGFALSAGTSSPKKSTSSSTSLIGARPPSQDEYAAPLPSTSKIYAGRPRRRTSRGSVRRR